MTNDHDRTSRPETGSTAHGPRRQDDERGSRVRAALGSLLGAKRVRRLLGDDTAIRVEGDTLEVTASDRFSADLIERRLGDDLRKAAGHDAERADHGIAEIRVLVGEGARRSQEPAVDSARPSDSTTAPGRGAGQPSGNPQPPHRRAPAGQGASEPRLEDFVVGASNRVAYEAVRRTVEYHEGPGFTFIHGVCGVGKSHLVRGAARRCRQGRPGARVRSTTGEAFVRSYVAAIRAGNMAEFQARHRRLDLLVIDDVHIVAGKEGTQQELVRTLNDIAMTGGRVILASDAHPRAIQKLHASLSSRFVSGLVVEIERPDPDTASRILRSMASRRGLMLPPEAIESLVHRGVVEEQGSVRDLEGMLTQAQALASVLGRDTAAGVSAEHVRRAVEMRRGDAPVRTGGPISVETLIDTVCERLSVTRDDLSGSGRQKRVVLARELIVHVARRVTGRSYPELAMAIGRPNHSTVITAHNRFKKRLQNGEPVVVGGTIDGCTPGELVAGVERAIGAG